MKRVVHRYVGGKGAGWRFGLASLQEGRPVVRQKGLLCLLEPVHDFALEAAEVLTNKFIQAGFVRCLGLAGEIPRKTYLTDDDENCGDDNGHEKCKKVNHDATGLKL